MPNRLTLCSTCATSMETMLCLGWFGPSWRAAILPGAVFAVTARRLPEVEADWRSRWTFGVGWTAGFLGRLGEYVFGIGGLMLVVAGVLRRRQFRRRLQEMEEEEALVDALMAEMRTPSVAAGADRR